MTFVIHANLDQEAIWSAKPLPNDVKLRISRIAALAAALAPEGDDVEVHAPSLVPPLDPVAGWTPPIMRGGTPPAADLVWARETAQAVNDRRFGLKVAREAGFALPGARVIGGLGELAAHLEAGGADASEECAWVCKAPWTSAGRDRFHGTGLLDDAQRAQVKKLLAHHRALVFEPWLRRTADFAVCAYVDAAGVIAPLPPHRLRSGPRGGFQGIALDTGELGAGEYDQLMIAAQYAGGALHRAGYAGPFGIDAFVYDDRGTRRFHPCCELNVRFTFGHVAHALGARLGIQTLGFGPPPEGATVLVTSCYTNTPLAWVDPITSRA